MNDSTGPRPDRHADASSPQLPAEKKSTCLCCGGELGELVYAGCHDYYLRTPFRVDYRRCTGCGLLQQSPVPSDVRPFYQSYPIHSRKGLLHRILRRLIQSPVYYRPPACRPLVLLDYGCGDGGYLESQRGRGIDLLGYEMDANQAKDVAVRLGLPVYSQRDEMVARHSERVDVVTMHFVLEHLTDLHSAFDDVRCLLRPGGTFYFVVPQHSSFEAKLFGRRWHGLDPPRHISFPEPDVVAMLATQRELELIRHKPVPFPNGFAGSIPAVVVGRFSFVIFMLAFPLGFVFSRLTPGGARAFWLKKR